MKHKLDHDIDFVDFNKITTNTGSSTISIFSSEWPLEVISTEIRCFLRECVKNPTTYEGSYARLLVLMQWNNVLGVLTSSGRREHYFDYFDFRRVLQIAEGDYSSRLTPESLNSQFEWVEKMFKEKFPYSPDVDNFSLGRLNQEHYRRGRK